MVTPHLASLAEAGLVLEQHYSQQVCSPTRAALLTGRWGHTRHIPVDMNTAGTRSIMVSRMV